jgi:sensor histidine kinase YesM
MKKAVGKLIGSAQQFSFEQRIFHFVLLLGVVLTAVGAIMDLYYGISPVMDGVFACFWAAAYYFARFRGSFKAVSPVVFVVLVFIFLPYEWLLNGGILSAMTFYAIFLLAVICIVLSGRLRIVMGSAALAVVLALTLMDARKLGTLIGFVQREVSLFDTFIHLFIVMAAVAVMITVYSLTYMKEKARSEAFAKAVEQHYGQQLYYMETLEGVIDRLKSERHDWSNHLGVIYGLLEDGDGVRAKAFASKLIEAAGAYRNIVNVPYSMLRAMLNYKLSAAKERGIALRPDVEIPDGLELEEADLTVIIGNLLDNAMEACAALPEEDRYIRLSIRCKRDYLVIQVENPVSGGGDASGGLGRTSKPDKENHGFGLRNIEYLVNKHSGLMEAGRKDGVFRVNLALAVHAASE